MKFTAIILAAGSGSRMGLQYNKILHRINGKRVLDYSLEFFEKYPHCDDIILVCSNSDYEEILCDYQTQKMTIITGGDTRQESVYKGLKEANNPYVLVHDSARPYLNSSVIDIPLFFDS